MEGWAGFVEDMRQFYGMDLDCLSKVRGRVKRHPSQPSTSTSALFRLTQAPAAC